MDKENLTRELEQFKEVKIGGVEITPIYGVAGYKDQFIDFLSPEWMEMLTHTLREADSLEIGVDMATGTGWPFGGPLVGEAEKGLALLEHFDGGIEDQFEGTAFKEAAEEMQNRGYGFDYISDWQPGASGLLGPVTLTPVNARE